MLCFQINALKHQHRDSMVDLLKRQLNEQLELAEKQLLPVRLSSSTFKLLTLDILISVCIFSLVSSLHLLRCYKETLFNNQELFYLVIIFPILLALLCDLGVKLYREIRC